MNSFIPILSVIVPAYNEQERIKNCLDVLLSYLPLSVPSWELIIVDDGSTDGTWSILEHYKSLYHDINIVRNDHKGKGAAVRTGMLFARGEYRLMMDVDLSTTVTEIKNALIVIEHADIVIGSREIDRAKVKTTFKRRVMGRIFHSWVSELVYGIRDTQCGFKMFRDYAAKDIFESSRIDGFAFDVEALYLAQKKGYFIREMPVEWHHVDGSKVRVVNSSLEMLRDVWRIPDLHTNYRMNKGQRSINQRA